MRTARSRTSGQTLQLPCSPGPGLGPPPHPFLRGALDCPFKSGWNGPRIQPPREGAAGPDDLVNLCGSLGSSLPGTSPPTSQVALGNLLSLSEPHCHHLENEHNSGL